MTSLLKWLQAHHKIVNVAWQANCNMVVQLYKQAPEPSMLTDYCTGKRKSNVCMNKYM